MTYDVSEMKAKLGDVVDSHPKATTFWRKLLADMSRNAIALRASSMALFAVISLFPAVAILVWVVGFFGLQNEVGTAFSEVEAFIPSQLVQLISGEIKYRSAHALTGPSYALGFHLLLLLVSAGSAARQTLKAFQTVSDAKHGIWMLNVLGRSIALLLSLCAFFVAFALVSGIIFVAFTYLVDALKLSWFKMPLQWLFMTTLLTLVIKAVFKWSLAGTKHNSFSAWPGAFFAAAAIALLTLALAGYNHVDPTNTVRYGTYGAIRNVLLWSYGGAFAFLLGAQINATLAALQTEDILDDNIR